MSEQTQVDFKTLELLVQELQNRIGQITSQYETNLAMLKAQATQEIQAREQRIQELQGALVNAQKETD
jgi:predicted RNase H-like nuclease (RuvC/YqgF family)